MKSLFLDGLFRLADLSIVKRNFTFQVNFECEKLVACIKCVNKHQCAPVM